MRKLLLLVLCVGALVAVGIVHFRKTGDKVNVSVDTGRLEDKADDFIDAVQDKFSGDDDYAVEIHSDGASEMVDRIEDGVRDAGHVIDEASESLGDKIDSSRRRLRR